MAFKLKIVKPTVLTFLLAMSSFASSLVWASEARVSGAEFYSMCTSPDANFSTACQMYIGAYIAGFTAGQQYLQMGDMTCLPQVTTQEVQFNILNMMRQQPDLLHEAATVPLNALLTGKYRCRPGETPAYGR